MSLWLFKLSKRTGFCCNTLRTDRRILYVPPLKVLVVRVLLTKVRGARFPRPPVTTPMERGNHSITN